MNQDDSNIKIQDLPSYKLFKKTSYVGSLGPIKSLIAFVVFEFLAINFMILAIPDRNIPLVFTALGFGGIPILFFVVLTDVWRKVERGEILYQYLSRVEDKYSIRVNAGTTGDNVGRVYYAVVHSSGEEVHAKVGHRIYKMLEAGDEVVVFSTREANVWALPLNLPE